MQNGDAMAHVATRRASWSPCRCRSLEVFQRVRHLQAASRPRNPTRTCVSAYSSKAYKAAATLILTRSLCDMLYCWIANTIGNSFCNSAYSASSMFSTRQQKILREFTKSLISPSNEHDCGIAHLLATSPQYSLAKTQAAKTQGNAETQGNADETHPIAETRRRIRAN